MHRASVHVGALRGAVTFRGGGGPNPRHGSRSPAPPHTPLLASTNAEKSSHVSGDSGRVVKESGIQALTFLRARAETGHVGTVSTT